jgi:hypothetical protein
VTEEEMEMLVKIYNVEIVQMSTETFKKYGYYRSR